MTGFSDTIKKPEILAPCGTWDALEAAVNAGADAVYLGGDMFSARAFAGNFKKEELLKALEHCHIYDVKVYLALNTLLKNTETGLVKDYIEPFYHAGLDGIIVQDMGVVNIIRDEFPDLPLHASTQMSVSSSFGARFLKNLGFCRVVPARELSLSEIRSVKEKAGMEIETFVHGAMCFAYSGKCLMSSFIGGRSGNRGRCAQPCRQCYKLRPEGKDHADSYVMSMKDMCMIEDLPDLIEAGIDSFKIEGRMKKPEYVAAVVSAYKEGVNMYTEGRWDAGRIRDMLTDMKDIYNRGGFSKGYYYKQNGPEMLTVDRPNHTGVKVGKVERIAPPEVYVRLTKDVNAQDVLEIRQGAKDIVELTAAKGAAQGTVLTLKGKDFKLIHKGMPVYRIRNNELISHLQKDVIEHERTAEVDAVVEAYEGKPLTITFSARKKEGDTSEPVSVTVAGSIVGKAERQSAEPEVIKSKMNKTKGSGLVVNTECLLGNNVFIQMSELNSLRRQAADRFKEALAARYIR